MTPSPKTQAPVRIAQGRVKSNTPPIVPGHHHYYNPNSHNNGYGRRSAVESVKEKPKEIDYFAGAKFDCLPSVSSLPTPPVEWTVPVLRSQSQPSSPVTTGVRIDVSSLFLTPQVNKVSHLHDLKNESTNDTAKHSIKQSENKTKKMMFDEIDTQRAKTVHHEKKVTTTSSSRKQEDTKKNGHHQHSKQNNKYSKHDRSAAAAPKSSSKVESKPIDIVSSPHHGTYHHKQMYPHLTESLRCLLKVQG